MSRVLSVRSGKEVPGMLNFVATAGVVVDDVVKAGAAVAAGQLSATRKYASPTRIAPEIAGEWGPHRAREPV